MLDKKCAVSQGVCLLWFHCTVCRWSELQVWPQGALVKHVRGLFKADGVNVTAEPGNTMHSRFYVSDHVCLHTTVIT